MKCYLDCGLLLVESLFRTFSILGTCIRLIIVFLLNIFARLLKGRRTCFLFRFNVIFFLFAGF